MYFELTRVLKIIQRRLIAIAPALYNALLRDTGLGTIQKLRNQDFDLFATHSTCNQTV